MTREAYERHATRMDAMPPEERERHHLERSEAKARAIADYPVLIAQLQKANETLAAVNEWARTTEHSVAAVELLGILERVS